MELRSSSLGGGARVWAGLRNDGKLHHRSGTKSPWGCLQKGTVKTASPAPQASLLVQNCCAYVWAHRSYLQDIMFWNVYNLYRVCVGACN